MKKVFWAVLGTALILSACGRQKTDGETAASEGEIRVRLLTDASGIDDRSFNAAAWRGITAFYGNRSAWGEAYDVMTAQTQDQYIPNIQQATDEGCDLIITTGFTFAAALKEVAARNPDQKYMIVDVMGLGLPNVLEAVFAEHEGSYLVGAAAALKAREEGVDNPRFGFIGGIPGATITKFEVGYVQGVLSVIPDARIVDYYVGSWDNPDYAKSQAKNWYDSGVYAIYSAAGASGGGTIAQAREYRALGRKVWAIGVDSDQYEEGRYGPSESAVLTSMLKRVETAALYGLDAVKNGTFRGEVITFDIEAGGVGYSTTNEALSETIVTRLEALKGEIVSGSISVAATNAAAKRLPGFPQDLKAMDD